MLYILSPKIVNGYHRDETGYTPRSFWKSILLYGLPVVIYVSAVSVKAMSVATSDTYDELGSLIFWGGVGLYLWYCLMSYISMNESVKFRRKLRHHTLQSNGNVSHNLSMEAKDNPAHFMHCCYSFSHTEFERLRNVSQHNRGVDFCTKLWNLVSSLCCGSCCSCWCMCCGICALAQENRQMKKLFPPKAFRIDFITHQPWDEYFPRLQALRNSDNMSMASHFSFSNLSKLSILLLKLSLYLLLFLLILALSNIDSAFTWENMIVLMFTLGQAVFVLYAVHWYYCRLDFSLDAVIKYFASGFVLGTTLAFVIEAILGLLLNIISVIIFSLFAFSAIEESINGDSEAIQKEFGGLGALLLLLYSFLNAFIIAAMTEELCKYFSYKMLRHPDFEPGNETAQTCRSRGAGITVAMVTASVGFACCENLMYVFGRSGGTLEAEISVLILRSLLPVHPVAAAIQSLSVIRHDVEGKEDINIGQIIFPAVILHGSYDFVLMALPALILLFGIESDDDGAEDVNGDAAVVTVIGFVVSVIIAISGVIYYFCTSKKQRVRLDDLDNGGGLTRLIDENII